MKNLISHELSFDDLVFENRNHAYGAFVIRKKYHKNMSKAILLAILFFIAAFLSPEILKSFNQNDAVPSCTDEFPIIELMVTPDIERVIILNHNESSSQQKILKHSIPEAIPQIVNDLYDQIKEQKNNNPDNNNTSKDAPLNSGIEINGPIDNTGMPGNQLQSNNTGILNSGDEVFLVVEELPVFGKGGSALSKYLRDKVRYPQIAWENRIEGKVLIEFIIDKNGEVKSAKLLRGIGGGCDEEALAAIEQMPKWKPGLHRGKPVNVKLVLPVSFKLYN